jgi:hypothetical protein
MSKNDKNFVNVFEENILIFIDYKAKILFKNEISDAEIQPIKKNIAKVFLNKKIYFKIFLLILLI